MGDMDVLKQVMRDIREAFEKGGTDLSRDLPVKLRKQSAKLAELRRKFEAQDQRAAGSTDSPDVNVNKPDTPPTVVRVKYKAEWNDAQRAAADLKIEVLRLLARNGHLKRVDMDTVDRPSTRELRRVLRDAGVDLKKIKGLHIDHIHELQLGGAGVDLDNLWPLDASVNTSLGKQIANQIKDLKYGTPLDDIIIE